MGTEEVRAPPQRTRPRPSARSVVLRAMWGAACPVRMGDATVCCAACRRVRLEAVGHPTGFSGCPLLQEKVERLRARTHYGGT
ncbi:hypothetical protein MRX96_020675 [Rhipicephalus microplus]